MGAPRNGYRPERTTKSSVPSAYQSASGPTARANACSGAMYCTVPTSRASCSGASSSEMTPKSRRTTRPVDSSTRMFDGLTSRWTLPASCRARSAPTSCGKTARSRCSSNPRGSLGLTGRYGLLGSLVSGERRASRGHAAVARSPLLPCRLLDPDELSIDGGVSRCSPRT